MPSAPARAGPPAQGGPLPGNWTLRGPDIPAMTTEPRPPARRDNPASTGPPPEAARAAAAARQRPSAEPADFDRLVADVLENPEILLGPDLTPEQVLEVQKRLNPYAGIAGPAPDPERERVRVAACSYTNLREDYLRRFTMTSLVGFLFQMHHEWEAPAEARRWTPAKAAKKAGGAAHQPPDPAKLAERLEATLAVAREAQAAEAEAAGLRDKARQAAAFAAHGGEAPAGELAAQEAAASAAEARAAALLYAATHATHRGGLDAGERLRATAEAAQKFPEVREALRQYPLPPPPGQVEVPAAVAKNIIGGFLRHWFAFDPSVHVRSGHDAAAVAAAVAEVDHGGVAVPTDTADPGHLTLAAALAAAPPPAPEHAEAVRTIFSSKRRRDAVVALMRDDDLADAALAVLGAPEAYQPYLWPLGADSPARPAAETVPPQDTFHRWAYYTEVNYEELRTVTEALYPERADLDWAIALWEVFEGSQAEVDAAFDKHCQRYQDEVPSSIRALEFGSWSLLADFKENRKKIQFYNKNTEVLKRILDRHADDKRIGAELMRNRVRQTKAHNIATAGPDAPGLKEYRRANAERGQDLGVKGVERVISPEEMRRLEKTRGDVKAARELELLEQLETTIRDLGAIEKGRDLTAEERRDLDAARADIGRVREMVAVPYDAVQVDVFTTNAATGEVAKSHFYTKAETPEESAARAPASPPPGASGHPAAALAPYAVEHMLRAGQRSAEEMRAEAVRDSGGEASGVASEPKGQAPAVRPSGP